MKGPSSLLQRVFFQKSLEEKEENAIAEAEKKIENLKKELTDSRKENLFMVENMLKHAEENLKSAMQESDQLRFFSEDLSVLKDEAFDVIKKQNELVPRLRKKLGDRALLNFFNLDENEKGIRKKLEETLVLKDEACDTIKKQSEEISGLEKTVDEKALHILKLEEEICKDLEQAEKKGAEQSGEISELRARVQELEKTASVRNAWAQNLQQKLAFFSNKKMEADAIIAKQIENIQESLKHLANF